MEFSIFIIAAPILQIIVSVFRIKRFINLPLGVIAILALISGISLSFAAMHLTNNSIAQDMHGKKCVDCGMVGIALFFIGSLISLILTTLVGVISSYIFYKTRD